MPRTAAPDGPGERVALLSRTTIQLRKQLEDAASLSGRSLGQEVERRLERTFDFDYLMGDNETAHVLRALGAVVARFEKSNGKSWTKDKETQRAAFDAVSTMLDVLMAPRDTDGPAIPINEDDPYTALGARLAAFNLRMEELQAYRASMEQDLKRLRPKRGLNPTAHIRKSQGRHKAGSAS